ncbi:MAG: hypothetical protein JWR26_2327 [Pedosphaera sp.]|nr:hypothetical protein [Pedosphaera sp.]
MNKKFIRISGVALALVLAMVAAFSAVAQSTYFNAVTNLNPVGYWPLQETAQPPISDVETNLGLLGPVANAYYSSANAAKGFSSAIVSEPGDAAMLCNGSNGGFLAVPATDTRASLPVGPFTVEAWIYPVTAANSGIVSQTGPSGSGGITGSSTAASSAGWVLSQNYIPSQNTGLSGWSFHVFNGNGSAGPFSGAESVVVTNFALNQWYHLVGVFDGTNCALYINGANLSSIGLQHPMTGSQARDTWDPLTIGCGRGLNNNRFNGGIDEVAIYTNALAPAQILNHYQAGMSASPAMRYEQVIQNDAPYMYWRMNSPDYNAPDPASTYPVAVNYGSATTTTINGASPSFYGTATKPGMPGPSYSGLLDGGKSYAVAFNGIGGANGGIANVNIGNNVVIAESVPVDVGYNALLNPTGKTPLSASIWFKANPADNRFQALFGHSDSSWRAAVDPVGKVHFRAGNGPGEITSARVCNDGNWHQLVGTYDGSSEKLYLDGLLDTSLTGQTGTITGSPQDVMIGGDPEYLNAGNGTYPSSPSSTSAYGQRTFSGSVAHFAYFTNALTAQQVQNLYSAAGAPPAIVVQPVTGRTNNGGTSFLNFGVVASGASPLSYQWYHTNANGVTALVDDGVKYASSTTSQLTVSNLVDNDSGNYFVVITNNFGAVTSSLASLQVYAEPFITGQNPASSFSVYQNQRVTLSVTAVGATNLSYQWLINGVADPVGTNAIYVTAPAQSAAIGTTYQCRVSNAYGVASNLSVSLLSVSPLPAILTNSAYSSNILALNPTAYWPMHEIEPSLTQRDIETNYGSLGQLADATFGDWQINSGAPGNMSVVHQQPGALAGDTNSSAVFTRQGGSYAVIPHTSPLSVIKAPFTLEAWVKPFDNTFGIILGSGGTMANRGLNGSANLGGFDWLWSGSVGTFSIAMRSGVGNGQVEPKTTPSYQPGNWYHLVTTFDGTNVVYYVNGVQDSLQTSPVASYNPDAWQPLTIGGGRWNGIINNQFNGAIDELAVYTNLLDPTRIAAHYASGTTGSPNYRPTVLADNPLLYYRMDSAPYADLPSTSWPKLTNYGTVAVEGVYRPSAVPGGVAGPSFAGISGIGFPGSTALACDGNSVFADAGYVPALNPTGNTPMSVAVWVKSNPSDSADRGWQTFLGHSDAGWRMNFYGGATYGPAGSFCFDAGNGVDTASPQVGNDGNWHHVVGTYDGTNTTVYVDGRFSASRSSTATIPGAAVNVYLGSYPGGTYTNYNNPSRQLAGNMCEAAFWNGVALSSNQVAALFNAAELPPLIVTQPVSASVNQGTAFTNTVAAVGTGPFTYHWYKDNTLLNGQTGASLVLASVQASDASLNYYVVVGNSYGSVTSAVVSLAVATVPTFTQQPILTNLTLFAGGHATFSVAAVGAQPLNYRWYSNNVPMSLATNATYVLTNAQTAGSPFNYYCVVSNPVASVTSVVVSVTVLPTPPASYPNTILAANPVGFWRLNEPDQGGGNAGVIAHDYWGGNNGVYTNTTLGQPGYNPTAEPAETSAQFGFSTFNNSDVYNIQNIDFSAPANGNSAFSIEAWVSGYQQTSDAGIVAKGYGGGGEQFNLDCGSDAISSTNPLAHSFRFLVRDASGATHNVNSSVNPSDTKWHHLVGVCDEPDGYVALYIDGALAGTNTIKPGSGILPAASLMTIGSRKSTAATNVNDLQFVGDVSDVAAYGYALSAAQVLAHYYSADIPAVITTQPTNATVDEFGNVTIPAVAGGTPPLYYQWYDLSYGQPIAGGTNASLVFTNRLYS